MSDTRKDKRAPVSLKVRFKSATVDEFIEQYAKDISHGGLFIKSKQPMAIGTLLKFEFQLKDESKLIQGVGRVVWKREAGDSDGDDKPAGMGIKFIKMDGDSKTLVDQIVDSRDATRVFGHEPERAAEAQLGRDQGVVKGGSRFLDLVEGDLQCRSVLKGDSRPRVLDCQAEVLEIGVL